MLPFKTDCQKYICVKGKINSPEKLKFLLLYNIFKEAVTQELKLANKSWEWLWLRVKASILH